MLNDLLLERALSWLTGSSGEAKLHDARKRFEAATGSIDEGAQDYESRIAHFFEHYL